MSLIKLPYTGWRRTATINTCFAALAAVLLIGFLVGSTHAAGSLFSNLVIFEGSCDTSGRLNIVFHLLLNIVSTLIVASSNYFMQVLNAPTREEVNKAHARSIALEIGIPSLHNIDFRVPLKIILWSLFALSSVPIHLLFNSAIFDTDYEDDQYHLVLATQDFVEGAGFRAPGASLVPAGASALPRQNEFGALVNITDYLDNNSPAVRNLTRASTGALSWTLLDQAECVSQYMGCTSRKTYGDVVIVVDSQLQDTNGGRPSNSSGFVVSELFDMTSSPFNPQNLSAQALHQYWAQFGPQDQPNPLWFSAQCYVNIPRFLNPDCTMSCAAPLGLLRHGYDDNVPADLGTTGSGAARILMNYYDSVPYRSNPAPYVPTVPLRPYLNRDLINDSTFLQISHCYAKPIGQTCKIGLSNTILFAVTLSVIIKVIICTVTLWFVTGEPLVTFGDALASFLADPDLTTDLKASLQFMDRGEKYCLVGPRQLQGKEQHRISRAIPKWVWVRVYGLLVVVLTATIVLAAKAFEADPLKKGASFNHDNHNGAITLHGVSDSFIGRVLIANTPQQVLSLCYFAYNALLSRVVAEKEWNSLAADYQPLRVSEPKGDQVSTYWLQLPYRYSIPLLVVSILLHWLVSNAIYVFIMQGGYYAAGTIDIDGIVDNAVVGVGFSSLAILLVLVVSILLLPLPIILTYPRLKNKMVLCGANSMVMSAACHTPAIQSHATSSSYTPLMTASPMPNTSRWNKIRTLLRRASDEKIKRDTDAACKADENPSMDPRSALGRTSFTPGEQKLKWGVIPMTAEWRDQFQGIKDEVGHLGFGTIQHGVTDAQPGVYYA